MAKKATTIFSCGDCGSQSNKWLGRCPDCNAWNSFLEETPAVAGAPQGMSAGVAPIPIDRIGADETPRINTTLAQFDRVLGGGIVPGSVVLIGGEPGIGKSTLLLQIAAQLAKHGEVLYVSGEESPTQIAMRAQRLQSVDHQINLYSETSIEKITAAIEKMRPVAVIIDSIQTVHTATNQSSPGSLGQVRDCAGMLLIVAKRLEIPIFLIGHITKEGTIAGPKTLEHIVDTVIYFEGDKFQNARLIRACKNRFGPVNEVALLEMHDSGLEEIANPSAVLLAQRSSAAGSSVVAAVEGTRPLLIEVQALVSASHYATPKRMAQGIDGNRLSLLLAVLERKGGESFATHDVYANIAGGLSMDEPAIDLGVIVSLMSSRKNRPLPWDLAIFGEVGLLGEIRGVGQAELRAREAAALGFKQLIVPSSNAKEIRADIAVRPVRRVDELIPMLFA
jgi:DNA repair protein RadA/Sms